MGVSCICYRRVVTANTVTTTVTANTLQFSVLFFHKQAFNGGMALLKLTV